MSNKDPLLELQDTLEGVLSGKPLFQTYNKEINDIIRNRNTLPKPNTIFYARGIIAPFATRILLLSNEMSMKMSRFIVWWLDNKMPDVPPDFVLELVRDGIQYNPAKLKIGYVSPSFAVCVSCFIRVYHCILI